MAARVKVNFNNRFDGELIGDRHKTEIGGSGESFVPYELLYGALSSCVHATVLGIVQKMHLSYDKVTYDVTGTKRTEIPTFLTDVYVKVIMSGVPEDKQKKMNKAIELGTEYCSIYNTLAKVAKMHLEVIYK